MASALLRKNARAETLKIKYSATRFRPYLRQLKAACLANPSANVVMNGKDPVTKFLSRKRKVKKHLDESEIPKIEEIFQDPRCHCVSFLNKLEAKLEKSLDLIDAKSTESSSIDTEAMSDEQKEADLKELKVAKELSEVRQEIKGNYGWAEDAITRY